MDIGTGEAAEEGGGEQETEAVNEGERNEAE